MRALIHPRYCEKAKNGIGDTQDAVLQCRSMPAASLCLKAGDFEGYGDSSTVRALDLAMYN